MQPEFWHQRWQRDEIGFHRAEIHPALRRHWPGIAAENQASVLVPLCGKSLDMRWLAERGHPVTGVELSDKAVREFFAEAGLEPERGAAGDLSRWRAGDIEIFAGDFFAWHTGQAFRLFYDRAALIALPPELRPRYLRHLRAQLHDGARGLLITLEYDQQQMNGPPFSVHATELEQAVGFEFELLEREDVLATHPRFAARGLSALHECTWSVTVRG